MAEQPCYCGTPIPADGPSDLYCSPACQTRWSQKGHDYLPIPARPEWRMGASEADWRRSLAWPDVPALPPQDVKQWIENTDPSPVAEQPEPLTSGQEARLAAAGLEGAAAGQRISAAFDRIRNATRRNT